MELLGVLSTWVNLIVVPDISAVNFPSVSIAVLKFTKEVAISVLNAAVIAVPPPICSDKFPEANPEKSYVAPFAVPFVPAPSFAGSIVIDAGLLDDVISTLVFWLTAFKTKLEASACDKTSTKALAAELFSTAAFNPALISSSVAFISGVYEALFPPLS